MRHRHQFPYETSHVDARIPLHDGTLLYARIWRPLRDEPVPALLEYTPGRLTDSTASRDWQRHPWYAGHGYASVRVDARGHGNSEGTPADPDGSAIRADGVEVVDWLAAQPWCTGRVGMFGLGPGATCALLIAALAPEPLDAIVTVCATDDPYDNDGRYLGGSVLADGTQSLSAAYLSAVCRPPDPHFAGEHWREQWLKRLETVEPPVHTWLTHQVRDDRWGRGTDLSAVRAAVLAVGGWHEPHRDTVLRLVERLPPDRVRGLIGPWSHQYPDHGRPGAPIGFLQETLGWWDRHLKGLTNDAMSAPPLRSWISGAGKRWAGEPAWPSPHVVPQTYEFHGAPHLVDSPQHTGLDAGPFRPCDGTSYGGAAGDEASGGGTSFGEAVGGGTSFGEAVEAAPAGLDQRPEDAYSACFEFAVGAEPFEILGRPRVTLRLRLDVPHGQVAARLCDIAPDGSSALVTQGVLNLAARHGRERALAWLPGSTEEVTFELNAAGHAFAPGHRVRLAVSSAYWPWLWPQSATAGTTGFVLDPEGSSLDLPVREHTDDTIGFEEPEQAEPLGVSSPVPLGERRPGRLVIRDAARGEWRLETVPCATGTFVHPDGLERTEEALEVRTILERDPHSARTSAEWTVRLHRPETAWDVTVETRSRMSCDAADFLLEDEVVCRDGREIVFHRTWEKRVPRLAG
ncbi:CocE/NonD family hydrolase [Streptomyces sp. NPDC055078]